jgi:hypothetical protein
MTMAMNQMDSECLSSTIEEYLGKGAIQEVSPDEVVFLSRMFTIKQRGKKLRAVMDARELNQFLKFRHFKMSSLRDALDLIKPKDFLTKIDIKDAYFHVPIHPEHQKYLGFQWNGRTFRCRGLPLGLTSAPQVFTRLMKQVMRHLHEQGITVIAYLDDLLIVAGSREEAQRHTEATRQLLESLGFILNLEKSKMIPAPSQEFLGIEIDTSSLSIRIPQEKMAKLKKDIRTMLSRPRTTVRSWSSLIGLMNHMLVVFERGRLSLRAMLFDLRNNLRRAGWSATMLISQSSRQAMEKWLAECHKWNEKSLLTPMPTVSLDTDASDSGWGFASSTQTRSYGHWSVEEREESINAREMRAILLSIRSDLPNLSGKTVAVRTDNMTTLSYLRNLGGASEKLTQIAGQILELCWAQNINLQAKWIPGLANKDADQESRQKTSPDEWRLSHAAFRAVNRQMGPLQIDLFASRSTHLLRDYFSIRPDPLSKAVDALAQPWPKKGAFANPPPILIPRIIAKTRREKLRLVLLTPDWPSQPWFPVLKAMSTRKKMIFDANRANCVKLHPLQRLRFNPATTRLIAWSIRG